MSAQPIDAPTPAPTPLRLAATAPPPLDLATAPWQTFSACAEDNWGWYSTSHHDPEAFFPKRLEGGQCAPAKALCAQCPVRAQCLTEGMREPSGVWGGLSEKERRVAQTMAKKGATVEQILTHFDNLPVKRRRRSDTLIGAESAEAVAEAVVMTARVIEQFLDITGTVPTGAGEGLDPLEPSAEVKREEERRKNGLR